MDGDRIRQALARIEAAAQRIEAKAARPAAVAGGDSDLQQRHEALRRESTAALRDIERLIEGLGG
jgi:hypothetical protein